MAGPMQQANRAQLSIPCATIAFSRFTFSGSQHAGPDTRGQLMAFAVRALAGRCDGDVVECHCSGSTIIILTVGLEFY
jgi:hypothetical protein